MIQANAKTYTWKWLIDDKIYKSFRIDYEITINIHIDISSNHTLTIQNEEQRRKKKKRNLTSITIQFQYHLNPTSIVFVWAFDKIRWNCPHREESFWIFQHMSPVCGAC